MTGLHGFLPARVTRIRCGWIAADETLELMSDGELLGPVRRFELDVIPGALEVEIRQPGRC